VQSAPSVGAAPPENRDCLRVAHRQITERARRAAHEQSGAARQEHLFADLEKQLRESERGKRVEFYTHPEGWKDELICGDMLQVMESLLQHENLRGKVR
jgi:hypothetical protein